VGGRGRSASKSSPGWRVLLSKEGGDKKTAEGREWGRTKKKNSANGVTKLKKKAASKTRRKGHGVDDLRQKSAHREKRRVGKRESGWHKPYTSEGIHTQAEGAAKSAGEKEDATRFCSVSLYDAPYSKRK